MEIRKLNFRKINFNKKEKRNAMSLVVYLMTTFDITLQDFIDEYNKIKKEDGKVKQYLFIC